MRNLFIAAAALLCGAGSLRASDLSGFGLAAGGAEAPGVPAPAQSAKPAPAEYAYENLLAARLWRSQGGAPGAADLRSSFLPPRSQGKRNMCNVFAAGALAEFLVYAREQKARPFSEEFLFYNTKCNYTARPELQAYRTEGGLSGYAAVLGLQGGVVDAAAWPFAGNWTNPAPAAPVTDPEVGVPPGDLAAKVLDYKFLPQAVRRSEIKNFITAERRPVVMNLMLYAGAFSKANTAGRLTQPTPEQRKECAAAGSNCGGHVVLLVGYDPAAGDFIFRNSWGAGWGEGGYGRVSEKYVLEDCEACGYLPRLPQLGPAGRAMMVNSAYGWSAELK